MPLTSLALALAMLNPVPEKSDSRFDEFCSHYPVAAAQVMHVADRLSDDEDFLLGAVVGDEIVWLAADYLHGREADSLMEQLMDAIADGEVFWMSARDLSGSRKQRDKAKDPGGSTMIVIAIIAI
ncbi:MAG: hypothetical protein VB858_01230 [Planctomycetaceae bacterium]